MKRKLKQVIESQRKAKIKITWRRQVSNPLGKGNNSTHLRQNYAQAKSTNHQTKARKPQRAPPAHMRAPIEPMLLSLDICMQTTWRKQSSYISSSLTSQTGHHHRSNRCSTYAQDQHSDKSNRWPQPVRPVHNRAQKWLENTWKQAQTSPPCWQYMNQAQNAKKMQPRASQIDKIQHRMPHMSKGAS
jgi:hypothetical protein